MLHQNLREEELKSRIAATYFADYDCASIIDIIDFCVSVPNSHHTETLSLLWAEAKRGKSDIYKSIVQLILTIGKARTFDKHLPPAFLGAFDAEKIVFIPYNDIHDIFYLNDFNWNVTPSNYDTKEFVLVLEKVMQTIEQKSLLFHFEQDDKEILSFVQNNFVVGKSDASKIRIDKNNFITIYIKWLQTVKPTIAVNWDLVKKAGIIDGDFYLADLLSRENETLKDKLFVLLKKDYYVLDRKINDLGFFNESKTNFIDHQKAHTQFWNRYERPPQEQYWDYIVQRRDLLVPQDVRERKGSFFTPQVWVELSQRYLSDVLGEDWQDEYYIWDCAAGTGNLLNGLTNKYHIWASTLDKQDVDVMHDRIKNGANLLENHVFQFDFLNDDFTKLPKTLQTVINNPEKRRKLVIYINPPYVESNGRISTVRKDTKNTKTYERYATKLEKVGAELFVQFLIRIYIEIPDCIIGQFSTLKAVSASNSTVFRSHFLARLDSLFVIPSYTFDNVKGKFPIGFFIWKTNEKEKFKQITASVYGANGRFVGTKMVYSYDNGQGKINGWLTLFAITNGENNFIGVLMADAPDFQNNNFVAIQNNKSKRHDIFFNINKKNIIQTAVYFAVRKCIPATWLNDRDQFLYPNEGWQTDTESQNDCLAYALFHGQNRISSNDGINHWIPFTEQEVDAKEKFASNFMTQFIKGKLKTASNGEIFDTQHTPRTTPLVFSAEANAVFEAGQKLWQYYHQQPNANTNASLYDIRQHFQGYSDKGRMNNRSTNETYHQLVLLLRDQLKILAQKIIPKVYQYGFLK
ncbi:MAG: hypothetical protein JNM36_09450 [Chitinophagales bacterium]|nr:hypothetical protein [Chitinophagales bacterium]